MTIAEKIAARASFTEAALIKRLEAVKNECADCPELAEAMSYAVLGGGKRVRPFLTFEFCSAAGGCDDDAEPFACAVELIHSYSLVHDDMPCMDDDEYRRGRLSVHAKFGEAAALLCGDALLTLAFETAASSPDAVKSAEIVKIIAKYAGAAGMCGGQAMDLSLKPASASPEQIRTLQAKKTGALFKAAAAAGIIASGRTDGGLLKAALDYAEAAGAAFQIRDDLLDDGTEENRATILSFMSRDEAEDAVERYTRAAAAAVETIDKNGTLGEFVSHLAGRKK